MSDCETASPSYTEAVPKRSLLDPALFTALEAVVQASPDLISVTDSAGRYIYVSLSAARALGTTPGSMLGKTALELAPEQAPKLLTAAHERVLETGSPLRGEGALVTVDGIREFEFTLSPIGEAGAAPEAVLCIARDVTERRRAEEARSEAEERLRLAVEGAGLGTWHWDIRHDRQVWSVRYRQLLGLHEDSEASFQAFLECVHPDDRPALEASAAHALATASEVGNAFRVIWPDGTVRSLVSRGYLYRDAEGSPLRMEGVLLDVTERRQLEDRLRQAEKLESIGRLAGGIAHDFNNLTQVMLGYTELLADALPDAENLHHYLDNIRAAAGHAADLTRQMLAFARKQPLVPRVIAPEATLNGLLQLLKPLLGESITVEVSLNASGSFVRMDPGQLEQVLTNLIMNARDAMPDGGTLTVETRYETLPDEAGGSPVRYVRITVADTGTGLTDEAKARLFEPFFTTKPPGKGTGLGLATVYGVVTQSGGRIETVSETGRGAAFHVYLPLVQDAPQATASSGTLLLEAPRGTEVILMVEDEAAVRELAVTLLRQHGYAVLTAENGISALEVAKRHAGTIDLLITDVVMPLMGGLELAGRLCQARPGLPVLFLSGHSEEILAQEEARRRLLPKPFSAADLLQRVRFTLDEAKRVPAR